jgi:hypothetical protein
VTCVDLVVILNSLLNSLYSANPELDVVEFPEGIFSGLSQLVELNLLDLNLKSLPENSLDELQALSSLGLNLKNMDASALSPRLFEKVSFLNSL